jgi:hypothetical protein
MLMSRGRFRHLPVSADAGLVAAVHHRTVLGALLYADMEY